MRKKKRRRKAEDIIFWVWVAPAGLDLTRVIMKYQNRRVLRVG
jgi:hypothetical protein